MLKVSMFLGEKLLDGEGSSTDFSKDEVRVEANFPASLHVLPIGGEVRTKLSGPNARAPLDLAGRVVLQAKSPAHIRVGVAYPAEYGVAIRNLLHNRAAVRVRPSVTLPAIVRVPQDVAVQVFDISTGGVALLLAEEAHLQLLDWTLELSLRLPGNDAELELHGNVCVRKLAGSAILYGVEFDEKRTPGLLKKQELIHTYVMQRQAEILRERAQRRLG